MAKLNLYRFPMITVFEDVFKDLGIKVNYKIKQDLKYSGYLGQLNDKTDIIGKSGIYEMNSNICEGKCFGQSRRTDGLRYNERFIRDRIYLVDKILV